MTWDSERLWHYRAKLIRVIDGDTLVVLVDTGFWGRQEVHVRLIDVYARELRAYGGVTDREKLVRALANLSGEWPLRVVTLQKEKSTGEVTTFERYVGEVFIADTMASVNVMLNS